MAEPIEIRFRIDADSFRKMEQLNKTLGTPNIATAIYSAVQILSRLYDYENQGYRVAVVDKSGRTHPLPLPKVAAPPRESQPLYPPKMHIETAEP